MALLEITVGEIDTIASSEPEKWSKYLNARVILPNSGKFVSEIEGEYYGAQIEMTDEEEFVALVKAALNIEDEFSLEGGCEVGTYFVCKSDDVSLLLSFDVCDESGLSLM